ncbi:unnamed protein product [Penicillium roqueforti FM164]|uniref:Genomic scaffold, ProqFM164S01 n=1 Tax=Penicillium roqueforti (strain FM164) TaxID=1365484 RepID=W6PX01_PENRF|nr:unnamed protein product [Penicillium roqueforti FM164]
MENPVRSLASTQWTSAEGLSRLIPSSDKDDSIPDMDITARNWIGRVVLHPTLESLLIRSGSQAAPHMGIWIRTKGF